MKKKIRYIGFLILSGAIFLYFSCKGGNRTQNKLASDSSHKAHAGDILDQDRDKLKAQKQIFQCPMHPNYTSDKPGECPICGMDLVPVEKEEKPTPKKKIMYRSTMNPNEISDKPGKDSMGMEMVPFEVEEIGTPEVSGRIQVRISPERQQMIGIKSEIVKLRPFHKLLRTVGRVDYVEPNMVLVNIKFDGWVEKLYVNSTGMMIKKGEPLLDIYSPELVSAQKEYLLALKADKSFEKNSGLDSGSLSSILKSAKEKLRLWDIQEGEIKKLELTGEVKKILTLYSPGSGFVIEKNVLQGQKIMSGENLYKIADLRKVWIYGEVYEYELPFVKAGQEVIISLPYYPSESFKGKITYIYPYLNAETRTNRIRIEVENPDFKLKPEMYANLEIHIDYGQKLAIPADAVLDAGEKKIAFVDKGDGYLEPREIKLGVKGEDLLEVLEGVIEGERVVTSANFLIDSESSLKAALKQMTKGTPGGHEHD